MTKQEVEDKAVSKMQFTWLQSKVERKSLAILSRKACSSLMYREQGGAGEVPRCSTSPEKSSLCMVRRIASTLSPTLSSRGEVAETMHADTYNTNISNQLSHESEHIRNIYFS